MIDSEIVKPKIKIDKKPSDSEKALPNQAITQQELLTYITKLEQLVIQKRTQIIKERKRFQGIIQSLARYLDIRGISARSVEDFLEPLNQTPLTLEEDDIADWYAYLETRFAKKPISNGIVKSAKIEVTQITSEPQPQQQSSNIIRISKNDLPNIPKPNPQRKYNKKVKLNKEEVKLLQNVDNQLQNMNSENGSLMDFGTEKNTDLSDAMKEKRKRKPKRDPIQQKTIQISPHDLIRPDYISLNPLTDYRTKQQAPLHFLQLQPSGNQDQRLLQENHPHVHEIHHKDNIKEN